MQEGFSKFLEHMTWKNSFSLSREIVEDGKLMDLKKQPAGFITSYYRTREKFGAALLGAAITGATSTKFYGKTFSTLGADGKCLFAKEHPSALGKKKQSNLFADGFSSDALAAAESAMQDFRGDNEEVLDVAPTTILIPNEYTLKRDSSPRSAQTKTRTPPTTASTSTLAAGTSSSGRTSTSLSPQARSRGCCWTASTTRNTAAPCGLTEWRWRFAASWQATTPTSGRAMRVSSRASTTGGRSVSEA